MYLQHLGIEYLRLIKSAQFELSPNLNFIYGENASGKTTILEAIHILSTGRSFRSRRIEDLIQYQQPFLRVAATIDAEGKRYPVGIEKSKSHTEIRIQREKVHRQAELSRHIPYSVLHPESVSIILGAPAERRAFIDWLVFYRDIDFHQHWKNYQKILRQRNACLQDSRLQQSLPYWTQQFVEAQWPILDRRLQALEALNQELEDLVSLLLEKQKLEMRLQLGFPAKFNAAREQFFDFLQVQEQRDIQRGNSQYGIHRANLQILLNGKLAAHYASRGQLKLITMLLFIARHRLVSRCLENPGILALDDLSAELDNQHRHQVIELLQDFSQQIFVSSVDKNLLKHYAWKQTAMFHVKQGEVVA